MSAEDPPATTPGAAPATALAGDLTSKDPAAGLQSVVALRRLLGELERLHVDNARDQGWTWQAIATGLQVSRQSVHEKHASRRKAGLSRLRRPPCTEPRR